MKSAFGKDPIQIRTAGGSIPISPFVITLGLPAVAVPTLNPDNRTMLKVQYSKGVLGRSGTAFENLRLGLAIGHARNAEYYNAI